MENALRDPTASVKHGVMIKSIVICIRVYGLGGKEESCLVPEPLCALVFRCVALLAAKPIALPFPPSR